MKMEGKKAEGKKMKYRADNSNTSRYKGKWDRNGNAQD